MTAVSWFHASRAAIRGAAELQPRAIATRGGQSRYSALAIATALTLKALFRLALRQTEGLIGSIIALLGLDLSVPDHTTLSRRTESLDVVRPRPGSGPVYLLVGPRLSFPSRDRRVGEPHRRAAALTQGCIVGSRVRGAMPLLWDMVATLGIGFERHDNHPGQ